MKIQWREWVLQGIVWMSVSGLLVACADNTAEHETPASASASVTASSETPAGTESEEGSPSESSGDSTTTPIKDENTDPVEEPEEPVDAHSYYEVTTDTFNLAAGEERFLCYAWNLEQKLTVDHFAYVEEPVVHHLILSQTVAPEPDGMTECDVLFRPTWVPVYVAGTGGGELALPDGVGHELQRGEQMVLQLHLLNATGEDVETAVTVRMRETEHVEVVPVDIIVFGNMNIALEPFAESVVVGNCTIEQPLEIFAVFPHMHYLGTSLTVEAGPSEDELEEIYKRSPWNFDDQRMDPFELALVEGDRIRVTCEYENPTESVVTFGESSLDEMCFLITYAVGYGGGLNACIGGGDDGGGLFGFPEDCGADEPNSIGLGAECNKEAGDCADGLACTLDLVEHDGAGLCIGLGSCETSDDCGDGGAVCCAPVQAGGLVNLCLPASCVFDQCPIL